MENTAPVQAIRVTLAEAPTRVVSQQMKGNVSRLFMVAAAALVVSVAVMYWTGLTALESQRKLLRERGVIERLTEVLSILKDAETGQRGYLMTGEERYLEPYNEARAKFDENLADLRRLAGSGELQDEPVRKVIGLTDRKLAELDETIKLRRAGGLEAALNVVRTGMGRRVMDEIRSEIAGMLARQEMIYQATIREVARATWLRTGIFVILSLGNLMFLGWAFRQIGRAMAGREQLYEVIAQERDRLSALVGSISDEIWFADTEGKFTLVNPSGNNEFALGSASATEVRKLAGDLEVRRPDGSPRPIEEAPPLRALRGDVVRNQEEIVRNPANGELRYRQASSSPVKDSAGNIIGSVSVVRDITERKTAEEALKQSEQRFRTMADAMPQLAWIAKADGWIHWYNRRWYDYTGTTPEQMEGWGWQSVHDPVALPKVLEQWQACIATGEAFDMTFPLRGADGVFRPFLTRGVPMKDEQGNVIQWFGTNTDVTDQKRAGEALKKAHDKLETRVQERTAELRENQQRFTSMLEGVRDYAIIFLTPDGRVTTWNKGAEQIKGYEADEIVGQSFSRFYLPEDIAAGKPAQELRTTLAEGRFEEEDWRVRKDGSHFWASVVMTALRDADGKVNGVVKITRDLTNRKQAEAALEESERAFRTLAESMPQMVWMCLPDGMNVYFNQRWADYTGLTLEESYGRGWNTPFHPDDRQPAMDAWNHATATGEIYQIECRLRRSDGSYHWFITRGVPFRDSEGHILKWFGTCTDIDDMKRAETEIRSYAADLQRSNRELEHFAYVASHDLQEPLRAVSSFSELLAKRYHGQLDNDADEFITFIIDGAKRMQNLINDLLTFSRVGTRGQHFTRVKSEEILQTARDNLEVSIAESAAIITHDPLPMLVADQGQLTQLLQNLLGNAIKFHRPGVAPRIHVSASHQNGSWQLSVRDNGIGILPDYFERIFILFQRLHGRDTYPGTGIGLAICMKIAERHGGRLWVESELESGSTFHFTIPDNHQTS
jgi:PAS domain S-box-containing protein